MKSRDKIVIIMLQWMRLYTLGSRGSRELKTFLEIRLISSRIDQKFKNKGRIHGFLKGKLAQRSWAIEAVVEAVLRGRGSDYLARCRGFNSAANPLRFCFQKHHDRATIAFNFASKRSHDRFNFASTRSAIQLESCAVHRGLDSTMEEPRSRFDRTAIVEFFRESFKPTD